jgi:hypothetical protein
MTVSILSKVDFYHTLDMAVQLPAHKFEVLLRRMIPSVHKGTDVLFDNNVWGDVGELSGSGTDR